MTTPPVPARRLRRIRLALGLAVLLALAATAWALDLHEVTSVNGLRDIVKGAGVWGPALFLVLFAVTGVTGIPGMPFVLAAMVSFGPVAGPLLAFLGALSFSTVGFFAARWAGGTYAAEATSHGLIRRVLEHVEAHPLLTVIGLRLIFFLGPIVAYGLALTEIPFRTYLLGTALGLLPLMSIIAFSLEWWLAR